MPAPQRREQLLDVCARVVDTEGFHAATIDRIAADAGVTRTVVYQHFGSLDGMIAAVIGRAAQRAGDACAAATSDWSSVEPRDAMAAILAAADADPATWRMFLVIPTAGPPALTDALERGRAGIRRHVAAGMSDGAGDRAARDPELAARLLQVVADELVRLRLADPSVFSVDRLLDQYDAVVGTLKRASRPRNRSRR